MLRNWMILLLVLILLLASLGGFAWINAKITEGSRRIAAAQIQLAEGKKMLAAGKARLASGKRQLSSAKGTLEKVKTGSYLWSATLPLVGAVVTFAGNEMASRTLAEKNQLVVQGAAKIRNGEAELAAGKLALIRGQAKLKQAEMIRSVCAVSAIISAILLIVLLIIWRKSLWTSKKA